MQPRVFMSRDDAFLGGSRHDEPGSAGMHAIPNAMTRK
jgi:hypothetical protein